MIPEQHIALDYFCRLKANFICKRTNTHSEEYTAAAKTFPTRMERGTTPRTDGGVPNYPHPAIPDFAQPHNGNGSNVSYRALKCEVVSTCLCAPLPDRASSRCPWTERLHVALYRSDSSSVFKSTPYLSSCCRAALTTTDVLIDFIVSGCRSCAVLNIAS